MTTTAAVVLALIVAIVIVKAFGKPIKTAVGGIFIRDKKGRMTLVLTPAKRKKGKGKR